MQTKNIFKTLAFAMLMPTMLLTTACSSEDDVVNSNIANIETVANKGYALPVTVNVTREGDKGSNRASYTESTGKLAFSTGDKLFVKGNDYSAGGAGSFAGTLTWQSGGTFSGTILTQNEYTGTIDDLFAKGSTLATLIPANYVNYSYFSFTNEGTYEASVTPHYTKTFASSKATAVEQFSNEVGGYTFGTGFALIPTNAILNFTITCLATNTGVDVALSDGVSFTISGGVTTDDSGTATFAIGVRYYNTDLNDFTLKVGGKSIPLVSSSKKLAAGKIYNINRAAFTMAADATSADKGKLICTDGHIHAYGADAGCTKDRVAMIAYVGATGDATYSHGLALALEDVSNNRLTWNNTGTNNGNKSAAEWCSSWNTSKPVTGATWLLASQDQWGYMLGTNGAGSYTALRDGFNPSVGGTNMVSNYYWTSTEKNSALSWVYDFTDDVTYGGTSIETSKTNEYYVRACLAF